MEKKGKIVGNIVWTIIMIVAVVALIKGYENFNYNDFTKSVERTNVTKFTRDSEVTYNETDSYKIESADFNDAMFYQTIDVTPNTNYKVTCKIKTKEVQNEKEALNAGAQISLVGTTLRTMPISGTHDWQEVTFMFNSRNNEQATIGFRLGGYDEDSKGTAWFSDFKVEQGTMSNSNTWKFVCFIFPQIDVKVNLNGREQRVKLTMSERDIQDIKENLERFKMSLPSMSQNKMKVEYDIVTINEPITTLSYDTDNGYYIAVKDVYELTHQYLEEKEYDHIYVAARLANKQKGSTLLTTKWIGLGGMDYLGVGYSNISIPEDEENYAFRYHVRANTFPEEVFIHEFLHTLERNSKEYGYEIPELHAYAQHGYQEDKLNGLKTWYEDYMNCNISYQGKKIGLPPEIFNYKPVKLSDFKYSYELDVLKEPKNIIEVMRSLGRRIGKLFSYMKQEEITTNSSGISTMISYRRD